MSRAAARAVKLSPDLRISGLIPAPCTAVRGVRGSSPPVPLAAVGHANVPGRDFANVAYADVECHDVAHLAGAERKAQ